MCYEFRLRAGAWRQSGGSPVCRAKARLVIIDTLGPESNSKFEVHNRIEITRDPSHTVALRLTTFLETSEGLGLDSLARRSSDASTHSMTGCCWPEMRPGQKRCEETRRLLEESLPGDWGGYSAQAQRDDITITHHEEMFLLLPTRS